MILSENALYIKYIRLKEAGDLPHEYPYTVPALAGFSGLRFRRPVTFIVGENGMGKSTLLEAIAVKAGFNAEGGSKNFRFATRETHSPLYGNLVLGRGLQPRDGYFLRAESFYNVATEIDQIADGIHRYYGDKSLHRQSHGESFLSLLEHRLRGNGLYIFDEPEAGIDLWSFARLTETFEQLRQRELATMIIISHQERIIQLADEIVVVGGGELKHRGSTEEIFPLIMADTLGSCPVLNK